MSLRARSARDDGQLTLLIIGYFLISVLLITVVINVSRVLIVRRALHGVADGAAIAAANAVDETSIYRGQLDSHVPLSDAAAEEAVSEYVEAAGVGAPRFPGFGYDVTTNGTLATVTAECVVVLPLVNIVSERWASVPISATASATSPIG